MKKLFAMFLALTMTFQLITPAWADAAVEEPEEVTEASEVVEEEPQEETTEATEEALPEETTEATEEETEVTEPTVEELPEEEEPIMEEVPGEEVAFQTEEGVIASGTCGTNVNWVLTTGGTLTISGTGRMEDYAPAWDWSGRHIIGTTAPWNNYSEKSIINIVVNPGVGSIGDYAFRGCSGLTSVTIPEGVTSIGREAFYGCSSLTSVTIPEGVTSIGREAFYSCSSLTSVTIPEGVTSIGEGAFYDCNSLTSVTIPEGVTSIGGYAFYSCSGLTSVTIPEGVTSIGYDAFRGCSSLTSVSIAKSVRNIGYEAFYGCDQLTDITFAHRGYDPLAIGGSAFRLSERDGEPVFTTVHVPTIKTMNRAIRDYDWTEHYNDYQTRDIAFEGSTQFPMTSIQIATQDGGNVYEQGVSAQLVATPDPLDSTDDVILSIVAEKTTADVWLTAKGVLTTRSTGTVTVRAACVQKPEISDEITVTIVPPTGSLSSLTVTTMNDYPGEAEIGKPVQMVPVFTPENAAERTITWSLENGTGRATIDKDGLLTPLTVGTVTVYATTPSGVEGSCTVNILRYIEGVTILVNGHTDVDRLGIGETVELSAIISPEDATTKDVQWSLANQTQIAELTVRDSSSSWPYSKLTGKRAGTVLVTATAKDSKQVVAQKVLTVTDSIRTYALPDGSGNLYYSTETGWITGADETVQNVIIPGKIDGVAIVGISPYAFADRDSWGYTNKNETLASVSIPASITEIGEHAFDNCVSMSTLRFAAGSRLKKIGASAFRRCSKLSSLTIPEGVEEVGKDAFDELSGLKNLTVSGELDTRNCMGYGYSNLDTLTLTGSYVLGKIKSEDGSYWEGYPGRNARKVILSESIQSVGDYAFSGYSVIEEVEIKGNLLKIGDYAFSNCNRLTTINLPDSLQSIGAAAFADCGRLSGIVLPNSLQTLGKDCFMDCGDLQIIDVSKAPDVFMEKRTYLTNMAVIPETLIRATNGKAEIKWMLNPVGESGWHIEASQDYETQEWYIYAHDSGKYRLICEDTYTGAQGSKLIEIKTGTVIRPADTGYLVSGGKLTLSAWNMPEETKANVFWSLAAGGQNYASIDDKGVLTAKTVYAAQQVTVLARPYDGGETVSKTIWILPKTTGLGLLLDGAPLGSTLNVDQAETGTLALSAQVYPEGALQEVQWSSSDEEVARVDEKGLVTLAKPGTAVIKATTKDGSKLTAQVTLNVTFLDPSTTLTLTGEIPQPGLEPGQTVQLRLKGTMAIDPDRVTFAVPSNQSAMGSVDETGLFTAGDTAGKVTVTAALKNDPLGRSASMTIPVVPVQARSLTLTPNLYGPGQVSQEGENTTVIFSLEEANSGAAFDLTAEAMDLYGNLLEKDVRFTSTDTSIAKVTQDGRVTLEKGTEGLCAIEARVADELGITARVWVSVRNYSPRLENDQVAVNAALIAGTTVDLVESYDNTIQQVQLSDDRFDCSYEDGQLTVAAGDSVKKGNYPVTLEVTCLDGQVYTFRLTLKVTSTLPKVTVKQQGKFNLFYKDSSADLTVTAPGAEVETLELTGADDFRLEEADGQWKLCYNDPDSLPTKPNTKGTLQVWLAGYREPVTVALNIAAAVTAPSAKFSRASSMINTALSTDRSTSLELLDKSGKPLELESPYVWTDTDNVTAFWDGSEVVLTLEEAKATSAVVYVQDSAWAMSLKLTHKITVSNKIPTLKPAGAITLNRLFPAGTAETGLILSQNNLSIVDVAAVPAAKAGAPALTESEKLNVTYDPVSGHMTASIQDADNAPKAGTYSFNCTGTLEDGTQIPGGTLKVTVSATAPKVKLSATSVKLNKFLAGAEQGSVTVTVPTGYQVVDFAGKSDSMTFDEDTGILTVVLEDASDNGGSYILYPVVRDAETGEEVELPTKLSFKVQAYNSNKLSVSLSAKGKLDTQTDSEIHYTVTKLANCLGTVDNVILEGQDKDLFRADMDVVNGKPTVHLTLVDGVTYATNKAYKIQFRFYACGQEILSPVQNVKVTQTALKVTVPKNITYYQAQKSPLRVVLTTNVPLDQVVLNDKTAKEFQAAVGEVTLNGNRVEFEITNPSALTAGKSYSVALDATPENNAENTKPVAVRLTVKVQK